MSKWAFLRSGRGRRRSAALLTLVVALVVGAVAVVTNAGASLSTHLVKVQRAALVPAGAKALGVPSSSASQSGDVALKPRNPAALKQYVTNLSDRTSPSYHHYLAAGQFASKFGPTKATIDAVKSTLTSDGLKVTSVSSDGLLVKFSGTTSKVESAFNTKLERYETATGTIGEETTSRIELPSNISSDVVGVVGLNTLFHPTTDIQQGGKGHAKAVKANVTDPAGSPSPCPDASAIAGINGGLTDDQIASAYGATPLYAAGDTGQNVHVGIYELETYAPSDIKTFDECYFGTTQGDSMVANQLNTIPVDGGQGTGYGSGEALLDIEDVSAVAPGADIDVYEAPLSNAAALDEYGDMVDADSDQVITSSWGECEQDLTNYTPGVQQSEYYIFEQAAAQGQTVLSAAGDTGDDDCNGARSVPPPAEQNPLSVDDPSSQPYVLAVGGTTIQDADPANFSETVWNDGAAEGAGGGGLSQTWTAPSWQQLAPGYSSPATAGAGTVLGTDLPNANTIENNAAEDGISNTDWTPGFCAIAMGSGTPCRALPDVTAQADEYEGAVTVYSASFASFGYDGGWFTFGGTSSASPIWAGLLALVDSSPTCQTDGLAPTATPATDGIRGIGFASPLLYAVAESPTTEPDGNSEYADAFRDVTTGNNDVYGFDNGAVFPARAGYDLASGLGSPKLTNALSTDDEVANSAAPGLAADLCSLAEASNTSRPTVTSLAPASGPVAGGTSVTITGGHFAPGGGVTVESVTVGNDVITVDPATDVNGAGTTLTVTTPAASLSNGAGQIEDGAGPADIVVTMSNGISSAVGPDSVFNYVDGTASAEATPTVSSVGPYAGPETPTTPVAVYGSGFTPTDLSISFGGVSTTSYTYISSSEIKVTPPAFTEGTTDCETSAGLLNLYGGSLADGGDGLTTQAQFDEDDVCQTSVTVTNANGTSTPNALAPDIEGAYPDANSDGTITPPAGTELYAQPSEYDYLPTPAISSITTDDGPADFAAAQGGTIIEIDGTGLNYDNYVNFGDPTAADSQDDEILAAGATYIDILAPATPDYLSNGFASTDSETLPVTVDSLGGLSNESDATYAGVPTITSVGLTGDGTGTDTYQGATYPVGPDSGGSTLTIKGDGFSDVVAPVVFVDDLPTGFTESTQFDVSNLTDTELDTTTVKQNPSVSDTALCTVSGCGTTFPTFADDGSVIPGEEFLQYTPGTPSVSSVAVDQDGLTGVPDPASATGHGPASGGTVVLLTGENLGCATNVTFGTGASAVPAEFFENSPIGTDCGSVTTLDVVVPPGTLGTTVPITVSTVASDVAGFDASTETGVPEFTYTASPTVTAPAFGSVDIGATLPETATVTNTGDQDLILGTNDGEGDVTGASVLGADASEFTITNDGCAGAMLAPGISCNIAVLFTPTSSGAQSATLDLPFNSSTTDLTAALTGTGTVPSTTVTTPATTVTTPATTVTTPGPTVTTPGTVTNTFYTCLGKPHYTYKNVKVKVRVKVNGKFKYEYKTEKKLAKTTYTFKCTTTVTTGTELKKGFRTRAAALAQAHKVVEAKIAAKAKAEAAAKAAAKKK